MTSPSRPAGSPATGCASAMSTVPVAAASSTQNAAPNAGGRPALPVGRGVAVVAEGFGFRGTEVGPRSGQRAELYTLTLRPRLQRRSPAPREILLAAAAPCGTLPATTA